MNLLQGVRAAVMLLPLAGLAACGETEWTATVYPNREDLTKYERLGNYQGLDACKQAASAAADKLPKIAKTLPGWECGDRCVADAKGDLKCRRIVQG